MLAIAVMSTHEQIHSFPGSCGIPCSRSDIQASGRHIQRLVFPFFDGRLGPGGGVGSEVEMIGYGRMAPTAHWAVVWSTSWQC